METAQIVIVIVAMLIAFLPFGHGENTNIRSISTGSSVMTAILNQSQTIGFQSGDCSL